MSLSLLQLSPALLSLFMLSLALVPLAIAWQDGRRRSARSRRVHELRREAQVSAELRGRGEVVRAVEWMGAERR